MKFGQFLFARNIQTVQTKVPDPKPTLSEISASGTYPTLKELLITLEALGTNVKSSMYSLEVADAIDHIMFCVKQVSASHSQRILGTLLYHSPGQRSYDHSRTLGLRSYHYLRIIHCFPRNSSRHRHMLATVHPWYY